MPSTFFIPSNKSFPMLIMAFTASFAPERKPLTNPESIYSGILSASFNPSNHSLTFFAAFSRYGSKISSPFVNILLASIQSRKATMASPADAVRLKISISILSRKPTIPSKAYLRGPPTSVATISNIANKPRKVRLTSSAVSLSIFNSVENLCRVAIISKSCSVFSFSDLGGNTSSQAFLITLAVLTIDFPMFSNDCINRKRPSISSILLRNLSIGMPNLSACCSNSLRALTCLSL